MPARSEGSRVNVAEAAVTGHMRDHEFVPMWLLVLCAALLAGILGVGGYLIVRAVEARSLGPNSDSSIAAWQAEVKANPADVDAVLGLGYAYQRAGRFEDALVHYDQVLEFDPRDLAALYNSGVCELELGRDDEGVESLLKVLDIAPGHMLASMRLGEYYLERGEYAQTVSVVSDASAKHPEIGDLKLLYAKALEKAGRNKEAAVAYQDALRVVPNMAEARQGLERTKGAAQ